MNYAEVSRLSGTTSGARLQYILDTFGDGVGIGICYFSGSIVKTLQDLEFLETTLAVKF